MKNQSLTVELSEDEALVFFEWLALREETRASDIDAETLVFWAIEAQLQKELIQPFATDYVQLVQAARRRIVDKHT